MSTEFRHKNLIPRFCQYIIEGFLPYVSWCGIFGLNMTGDDVYFVTSENKIRHK
jgi:hypothetical protein